MNSIYIEILQAEVILSVLGKGNVSAHNIYDGTLLYDETPVSQSFLRKLKGKMGSIFSGNESSPEHKYPKMEKGAEMKRGMLAMLPQWSANLMQRESVAHLLSQIRAIEGRQQTLAKDLIWPESPTRAEEVQSVSIVVLLCVWVRY